MDLSRQLNRPLNRRQKKTMLHVLEAVPNIVLNPEKKCDFFISAVTEHCETALLLGMETETFHPLKTFSFCAWVLMG